MFINPYGAEPVRLAIDLVRDRPATPAELTAACHGAGVEIEHPATTADVTQLSEFLDAWLAMVDAEPGPERAERLNALLAQWAEQPRLTDHSGSWHLHYRPGSVSLAHLLSTMISVGTALHLTERGMDRLGRCAAAGCTNVFADLSRNGTQRYCSPRCGSREAVRRHRAGRARPSQRAAGAVGTVSDSH